MTYIVVYGRLAQYGTTRVLFASTYTAKQLITIYYSLILSILQNGAHQGQLAHPFIHVTGITEAEMIRGKVKGQCKP